MARNGEPPEPSDQDAIIASFVASLCLETRLDPRLPIMPTSANGKRSNPVPVSDDIDQALHQLAAVNIFIWRELDPLVRFCVPRLLKHGPEMHPDHLEECLRIAFNEYVLRGHRLLMRRTLRGVTTSLTEMTKEVFVPKSKEYGDYRERLRNNILFRMRDIGLWDFTEEPEKKSKNGGLFHAGFKITAGLILLAFHKHIYMPWSINHAQFTCALLARKGC